MDRSTFTTTTRDFADYILFCVGAFVKVVDESSRSKERRTFIASDALLFDMSYKEQKRTKKKIPQNAKMVDDDDDDLSRQPNVLPLSSSMLPPPLIDRLLGFFGTTFDDFWVPRCRETVRNASRAAALNIVVEGGAFVSFFFAL